ncbi:hypothetical protein P9112_009896 [Eukaryota sp. TZLM1-RC]
MQEDPTSVNHQPPPTDYTQKYYWLKNKYRDLERRFRAQESELAQLRAKNQELTTERTHFIDRLIELEHLDEEDLSMASTEEPQPTPINIISSILCNHNEKGVRCGRRVVSGLQKCFQHAPLQENSGFVYCQSPGCPNSAKLNESGGSYCAYHRRPSQQHL